MPKIEILNSKESAPFVPFGEAYDIAEGARVFPLTFGSDEIAPPFKTTVFVVEAGASTPVDKHRVEELWVILEGGGILEYANQTFQIEVFDRIQFKSQNEHKIINNGTDPLRILSLYWEPGSLSNDTRQT